MTDPQKTVDALGLSIRSKFVPFKLSRHKDSDPKNEISKRTLNWRVTLVKDGRDILTTDYSAGVGHCPSYNQRARWTLAYAALIEFETDHGFTAKCGSFGITKGKAIEPKALDVIYSLVTDSNVIDYSGFEDWAENYGYDPDSREAESTYRACLEIALKLRNGLGESDLASLGTAFQDY